MTQVRDCGITLDVNPVIDDLVILYNTSALIGNWTYFFSNIDHWACPVTSCLLKQAGCLSDFTDSEFTISPDFPFEVSVASSDPLGNSSFVCVECTNGV